MFVALGKMKAALSKGGKKTKKSKKKEEKGQEKAGALGGILDAYFPKEGSKAAQKMNGR